MSRTRRVFFGILGTVVLVLMGAKVYTLFTEKPAPTSTVVVATPEQMNGQHVALTIASSSTKQAWMEQVVANFEAEGKTTAQGHHIAVEVEPVLSGGSMNAILADKLHPVVWSPGAESWVTQFREQWRQTHGGSLISQPCRPTVYTPLGIAMWRPMAEALGWPESPIGWQTIVDLAAAPEGWGRYGHPEWGKFRFGHAHPKYSNAGLLTMTSFVYGITGKTADLTAQEVYAPEVEEALRTLAQHTSKYGMITTDLLRLMAEQGPSYLHAVATFESDTIRLNIERKGELRFPLAFIFPAGGTFWGNHPYCILDNAPWVSEEQVEAATIFLNYLLSKEQQALAADALLRPLDNSIELHAPLDLEHGTDPSITPEKIPPLAYPDAEVSEAIIDLFLITKRKATVLIVLDISGSMEGEKIRSATEATVSFLRRLQADDRVGVLLFNDEITVLAEPQRVGDIVELLAEKVSTLIANGSTALYATVCKATRIMEAQRKADLTAGEQRLYGIVLLSDGDDTIGQPTETQMFVNCLPSQAEADSFKIFPIAFGAEANEVLLRRIANVTGGSLFTADPDSIEKIYLRISAEQ